MNFSPAATDQKPTTPVPDEELLRAWVEHRRQEDFTELVRRHLGQVQGVAERQLGTDWAEDVAQMVFAILDRKAADLGEIRSLGGWLHRVAVLQARKISRTQVRERRRNHSAMEIARLNNTPDPLKDALPHLDAAICQLKASDREVIHLRYSESLSFTEVSRRTGRSEMALRQQTRRAVSKLAELLRGRGVTVPAATLGAGLGITLTGTSTASAAGVFGTSAVTTSATLTSFTMTTKQVILTTCALMAIGLVGVQRYQLMSLRSGNIALSSMIASVGETAGKDAAAGTDLSIAARMTARTKENAGRGKIDWVLVAASLLDPNNGNVRKALSALEERLDLMSEEELIASLAEAEALPEDGSKGRILEDILAALALKNPRLALERSENVFDRISDRGAMSAWAAKDPTAAGAWLDRMIDEGKLDTKKLDEETTPRVRFERDLVQQLIGTDLAAAAKRMETLSENQRVSVCAGLAITPENGTVVADLIRKFIPPAERARTLAEAASLLRDNSKIGDWMAKIDATHEERAAIVSQAIREVDKHGFPIKTSDLTETRAWILEQAPADAERLTGELLAGKTTESNYAEMAGLAREYQKATGKDDALVALRESPEVRALLDSADESRRADLIKQFGITPSGKP